MRHDNEVVAIGPAEHLAKGQRNKDSECVGSLAVPAYVFLPHASVVITPWGRFENGGFFWYAPSPPFPPVCPSASNEREYKPGIGYGYSGTLVQVDTVKIVVAGAVENSQAKYRRNRGVGALILKGLSPTKHNIA